MTLINNEINLQNNDLKEQIFKDISTKLNEIERKNEEQIISLKAQINKINIQNNDFKEQIFNNVSKN